MEAIRGLATVSMCLFIMCNISEALDTSMLERICNGEHYTQDSVGLTVAYVLQDIETNTAGHKGFEYYSDRYLNSGWTIRGHGVCTSTLSPDDCSNCLTEAAHKLEEACTNVVGAQVQLEDCRIRYEKYHSTTTDRSECRSMTGFHKSRPRNKVGPMRLLRICKA